MTTNEQKFTEGQRVISPDGEGEVVSVSETTIVVKLNSDQVKNYTPDQLSDDSDAG